MNIFELFGRIVINTEEATEEIDEVVDTAESAEPKLETAFSKIGKYAIEAGKAIATGIAAGTAALTALLKEALELSGQVEQGYGGAEAVFGEYAYGIIEKSKTAYASMGVSIADYMATANKMGSLFVGSGYDIATAYDMTTGAMQRAADVAAIMGIDLDWAMESVAGMAKGNFTMMDNLGVAINETTLQAYALEKGITASVSSMTTAEKVGLAYDMFMSRTAYAMGRYAEENNTYAGSLNTAKAALQNWMAGEMGMEEALPYIQRYIDIMVEKITQLLPGLVEGLTTLMDALAPYLPTILAKIIPAAIDALSQIFVGFIRNLPVMFKELESELPAIIAALQEGFEAVMKAAGSLIEQRGKKLWENLTTNNPLSIFYEPKFDSLALPEIPHIPNSDASVEEVEKFIGELRTFYDGEWVEGLNIKPNFVMPEENATIAEIMAWWEKIHPVLTVDVILGSPSSNSNGVESGGRSGKFATGLDYVPRDNFLASLHKGEAVLTAKEADAWRKGLLGGQQVYHDETIVSGNTFVIRNEQDIYSLSAQIASMKREKRRGRGAYA